MLSPSANWIAAALKGTTEPRFLVHVFTATATSVGMLTGTSSVLTYPASVMSVSSWRRTLDPVKRSVNTNTCKVALVNDLLTSGLVTDYPLRGTRCEIYLGFADLAEVDFIEYFAGYIRDVIPEPTQVTIDVIEATTKLDNPVSGSWVNLHPNEVIVDILEKADLTSDLIDSAALAYDVDTTRSHHVVDRGAIINGTERGVVKPVKARTLIDSLAVLTNGALFVDETGAVTYTVLDTSSSDADWTTDDIVELEVISLYDDTYNQIKVTCHPFEVGHVDGESGVLTDRSLEYVQDDTDAQARQQYSASGATTNSILAATFDAPWIAGAFNSLLDFDVANGDTVLLNCMGAPGYACSGMRWPGFPSGSQPANSAASASRLVYLQIDDEIVSFDQFTIDSDQSRVVTTYDRTGEFGRLFPFSRTEVPIVVTARVAERGALGTTEVAHTRVDYVCWFYDVTLAADMAQTRIERFANGAPRVRVKTGLEQYAVQIGDVVTLTVDSSRFRSYNHSGLTTTTRFEVIGKSVDFDPPLITWDLCFAADTSPPSSAYTKTPVRTGGWLTWMQRALQSISRDDTIKKHVATGFGLTDDGGLLATIGHGVVSMGSINTSMNDDYQVTCTASKDNYISFDVRSSSLIIRPVTTGSGTPSNVDTTEVWLWMIECDGSDITDTTDIRDQTWIPDLTAVTDANLDDVDDGSTYKRVAGVDGSNQVTTTSIATDAVSAPKILASAVSAIKIASSAVTETKIGSSAVTEAKVGTSAITVNKIGSLAVSAAKIATGAVESAKIASAAVIEATIGTSAVTAGKIGSAAVTETKIGSSAVTEAKVGTSAITVNKIGSSAVTEAKVGTSAITVNKIGSSAVTEAKVGTSAITVNKIGSSAVTETKIDSSAVTEAKVGTSAITVNKIGALAVSAAKIASAAVEAAKIAVGAVIEAKLGTGAVTSDKVGAGAITEAKVGTGAVTTDKIGASAVTEAKVGTGAVTTDKIGASAVTESKVGTGAVTEDKIGADAVTTVKVADGQLGPIHNANNFTDYGNNLLVNGGFEQISRGVDEAPDGWWVIGSAPQEWGSAVDLETSVVKSGANAIVFYNDLFSQTPTVIRGPAIPCSQGDRFTISLDVYTTNTSKTFYVAAAEVTEPFSPSDSSVVATQVLYNTTLASASTWIRKVFFLKISNSATTHVRLHIGYNSATDPPSYFYVDRVRMIYSQTYFSCYRNGSQSIPDTTWTKVQINNELVDYGSDFDSSSNYRFTAPSDGLYSLSGQARVPLAAQGDVMAVAIYVNGASKHKGDLITNGASGSQSHSASVSCPVIYMDKDDYAELYVYQDTGGAKNLDSGADATYFQGYQIL
jgi:hypothetical protein